MMYLCLAVIPLLFQLLLASCLTGEMRRPLSDPGRPFSVCLPRSLPIVGIGVGCATTAALVYIHKMLIVPAWVYVLFSVLTAICALFVALYFLWRVRADEDAFTVCIPFGMNKTYRYDEVTRIVRHTEDFSVYVGDKRVAMVTLAHAGCSALFKRMTAQCTTVE